MHFFLLFLWLLEISINVTTRKLPWTFSNLFITYTYLHKYYIVENANNSFKTYVCHPLSNIYPFCNCERVSWSSRCVNFFFVKWNLGGNCVRVRHVTSSSTTSSRGREMKFSERLWKFVKVESESCDKSSARAIEKFLHTRNVNISVIQVCQMLGGFLLNISKWIKKTKKMIKIG